MKKRFQSTAPVWGPTLSACANGGKPYISIHGPRVGADIQQSPLQQVRQISIHGPRVGADMSLLILM